MFFVLSGLLIISNNDLEMYKQENLKEFSNLYTGWLDQVFYNLKQITGQTIKLDWLPK
jgi:hypothetical protein